MTGTKLQPGQRRVTFEIDCAGEVMGASEDVAQEVTGEVAGALEDLRDRSRTAIVWDHSIQTADEQGYNGWSNYETWAVKLWMDNDEGGQAMQREMVAGARDYADGHPNIAANIWTPEQATRFALADALKSEHEEAHPLADNASVFTDLLGAALSRVDWDEIAENILSEI